MSTSTALAMEQAIPANPASTLGWSLFYCPSGGASSLGGIRQRLELKLAACLATGGTNGFPVMPDRIKNPQLQTLIGAALSFRNWSIQDLIDCSGILEGPAASVLLATLDKPIWGSDDFHLFHWLERMEQLEAAAWKSGNLL